MGNIEIIKELEKVIMEEGITYEHLDKIVELIKKKKGGSQ